MEFEEARVIMGILENMYRVTLQERDTAYAVVPGMMVRARSGPTQVPMFVVRNWGFDLDALSRMACYPYDGEKPTVLLFKPTILQASSTLASEEQLAALYAGGTVMVARRVAWDHLVGVLCDSALWLEEKWCTTHNIACQNRLLATRLIEKIR